MGCRKWLRIRNFAGFFAFEISGAKIDLRKFPDGFFESQVASKKIGKVCIFKPIEQDGVEIRWLKEGLHG